MTTKAEPRQIVLMLFNIDVIFTHFILLFSRFDIIAAYGLIKLCKKGVQRPLGTKGWRAFDPKVLKVLRFDSGHWPLRVLKIDGPEGPKGS